MLDLDTLGELVRNRRLSLALRIDDAAHACGVAVNVLSRLENGNSVGVDRLLLVLSGLGLGMLITGKEEAMRYMPEQSGGDSSLMSAGFHKDERHAQRAKVSWTRIFSDSSPSLSPQTSRQKKIPRNETSTGDFRESAS
ncbi:transcriptional regulator [Burkholderia sp. 9120]|uniref:helix-turn-helix domain-containing protein n=1 Tax=Burkholderia sp. 9120 TaxID=1500897 RepID=UPI0007C74B6A|nr:transcriptional regulator [Burkholderia sp. 9120]